MVSARRSRLEQEVLSLKVERDGLQVEKDRIESERNNLHLKATGDHSVWKSSRQKMESEIQTLQADLENSRHFAIDLEVSLNDLQTRFEDKDRKFQTLKYDKSDMDATLEAAKRKQALHAADIAKLTNSRANLEHELKAARAALLSSEVAPIAELEGLNGELRTLRAAKTSMEKRLASQAHDNEYMRQQYQSASTAAAASANQLTILQVELEEAQRHAQGEATRLAGISRTDETRQALATVERQSLELASRERLLQKQAEELKELKDLKRGRGGVVTRGSSVQAKSPRGGSRAGSPGVGGSGYGGRVGGSGLRYGSGIGGDGK